MKYVLKYFTFIVFLASPAWMNGESEFEIIPDQATLPLLNPSLHDQKIEKIRLPNGLQVVLVSDPHVQQSAVTMTVMAGSWLEPDEFPGLAHFLEHMLFMGTTEYPEESSFTRFLTEHGGQTNAYTHGDYTSYMFALNNNGFEEGLKRFASFFKSPLFSPAGVSRELNAINQEFAQGFNNEDVREYHVLKHLASPLHPFSRFQTGNSQSLAKATTSDLKAWFDAHYSANLMRLYVLSSLPLNEMRDQVVRDFSGIANKNIKPFQHRDGLFTKDTLGHLIRIAPKNATQTLTLVWEIPSKIPPMLESRPADILCATLGYEGKNSLLANLKKEGLADSLGCGPIDVASLTYLLNIEIKLTAKGLKEIDTVIERVFQTLHLISETQLPSYVFEDFSEMLKQRYQFQQRDEPFEWAMNQAPVLAQEPIATFPELTKTLRIFNKEAWTLLLQALTPQNCIFVLTAPSTKLTKKEPWMQISYDIETIPEEKLKKWNEIQPLASIMLPQKNPFLAHSPSATKTLIDKHTYPALPPLKTLLDNKSGQVYYTPDPFYQVPRTTLEIQIQSPLIKDSRPQSVVMTEIYVKALKESLRDLLDEAQMADLEVSIERALGGFEISLEGFTESLTAFFPHIVAKLISLEITSQDFDQIKNSLQIEYENNISSSPIKQLFDRFKDAIFVNYTNLVQKRNAIGKLSFIDFQNFQENLLKQTYIKGVIVGSLSQDQAKDLVMLLERSLHKDATSNAPPYYAKIKTIDDTGPYLYNFNSRAEGDALLLGIEMEGYSPNLRNIQEMLSDVMSEAFFAELRTKQQTGYIVLSDAIELQKHLFTYFGVQSTTHSPSELIWRFELFIETYLNELTSSNIPKDRFESLKNSLLNQLKIPPANLKLFGERCFKLIFDIEDYNWTLKRLDDLNKLSYEDFIQATQQFLGRTNLKRFALSNHGFNKTPNPPFEYKVFKKEKPKPLIKSPRS